MGYGFGGIINEEKDLTSNGTANICKMGGKVPLSKLEGEPARIL